MSWRPPDSDPSEDDESDDLPPEPLRGQVRHSNLSARVPESVGSGVFSNGVMILTGQHECVLDFVLRMGEVQKIVARVVLPPLVAQQFERALRENLRGYETRFGGLPKLPRPQPVQTDDEDDAPHEPGLSSGMAGAGVAGVSPQRSPDIDEIYHDLKLPDEMLSGRYSNAVLIRHSGTEFCFDFLTNVYPRSAVSCRVFLASPQIPPFLESLSRALKSQPPPSDEV